jgi:hypothetical protein
LLFNKTPVFTWRGEAAPGENWGFTGILFYGKPLNLFTILRNTALHNFVWAHAVRPHKIKGSRHYYEGFSHKVVESQKHKLIHFKKLATVAIDATVVFLERYRFSVG